MDKRIEIVVNKASNKKRLDEFLFAYFGGLSKMYLRHAVKQEKCEVNGRNENVGYRLKHNDFIEIELDLTRETAMRPQEMPLDIVFEDADIIVVNKQAGMLVHPTNRDKSGTLLNALAFHLNKSHLPQSLGAAPEMQNAERGSRNKNSSGNISEQHIELTVIDDEIRYSHDQESAFRVPRSEIIRPGLVHRLDKQTSGLIVIAKHSRSHKKLTEWFRRKFMNKRYTALVEGIVAEDEGSIMAPIGRFGDLKYWDVKPDGKHSETRFWVKKRNADTTLLELEPVTGRTNQLRIHCAHIGHPIVGDTARGGREFERLCLHASSISFRHPSNGRDVMFESLYPDTFDIP